MDDKDQRQHLMIALSEAEMCSEFIVKYYEGPERAQKLKKIEDAVKDLCLLEMRIKKRADIMENMRNEQAQKRAAVENGEVEPTDVENVDEFDQELERRLSVAMEKSDVKNHQMMVKYKQKVLAVTKKVDKTAQRENGDDELVFTEESETHIDPITKKTIVDPVKSKVCNHQFSRATITQQIQAHHSKSTKCPYVGCNRRITEGDLETDYELAQVLDRMQLET